MKGYWWTEGYESMKRMIETEENDGQHGCFFQLRSEREMKNKALYESLKVFLH